MDVQVAYVGLGSNLGDRGEALLAAVKMIGRHRRIHVRKISQFIETEPVGGPADQPAYLHAAIEVATDLLPQELLSALQEIERGLGRDRAGEPRWGPRTCDLDILLIGEVVLAEAELTIPHPRMHERLFVLRPLASIAPQARHPTLGKTVSELLAEAERCRPSSSA